jgi:hypothetical protein
MQPDKQNSGGDKYLKSELAHGNGWGAGISGRDAYKMPMNCLKDTY